MLLNQCKKQTFFATGNALPLLEKTILN